MGLQDVVKNHTEYLVTAVLMGIPVCIWVSIFVRDLISGDMDTLVGICGALSVLFLGAASLTPQFYAYIPYLAFLAYGSFLVVPIGKRILDQKELKDLEIEKIEKAYQTLGLRPDNPGLKFRLAAMLFEQGMVDAAVSIGNSVIERMPQRTFPEEHRHLKGWNAASAPNSPTFFVCPKCGFHNKPGDVFCQQCASPFFLLMIKGPGQADNVNAKFISIWLTLIIAGIAIPAAFVTLPIGISLALTLVLLLICGIVLARAFSAPGEVTD